MVETHKPGQLDAALVPYFANPDLEWPISFYPQFLLNERNLVQVNPDRILVHHAFYNAYLNHRELTLPPPVGEMTLTYLKLRAGEAGYREDLRFHDRPALLSFYRRLFPDLEGLYASIYVKTSPSPALPGPAP
jgi:hypothetical protein